MERHRSPGTCLESRRARSDGRASAGGSASGVDPMKFLRLSLLCSLVLVASAATFDLADSNLEYVAGSGAVSLDANASLSEADFSSGSPLSLAMSITSGLVAGEDLLQIRAVGAVSVASGIVSVSGTPIGPYSGG